VLFRFFFLHIVTQDRFADSASAKGAAFLRAQIKNDAHLTSQEFTFLDGIAKGCNDSYVAESKNGMMAIQQLKTQYPAASPVPPEVLSQVNALEARRQQIILGCVQTLKVGMKPGRFEQLQKFVVATEGPRIAPLALGAPARGQQPNPKQ